MADNFKLPGSSYEEIIKIIKAYSSGKEGQAQPLDAIAQASGIDRTIVSRNNGFLLQMQLLMEGAKKTPTSECFSLGRAYSLNIREEVQKIWKMLIENNEFLTRMMSAIKIRDGMDKTALINHILYSAGSTTSASKVGANTIIEIFKDAGMVREEDGKILAVEKENVIDTNEEIEQNNQIKDTEQIVKIYDDKKIKNGTVVNININIDASVDQLDELSEKIKQLLNSINE